MEIARGMAYLEEKKVIIHLIFLSSSLHRIRFVYILSGYSWRLGCKEYFTGQKLNSKSIRFWTIEKII